jgi:hypothetical protein
MQDKWFEKEMETIDEEILCQGHFRQRTRRDYVIQKQEHKMCKINVKMDLYYANMNMKRT